MAKRINEDELQTILYLYFQKGMKPQDIAAMIGRSYAGINSVVSGAKTPEEALSNYNAKKEQWKQSFREKNTVKAVSVESKSEQLQLDAFAEIQSTDDVLSVLIEIRDLLKKAFE